MSNIKKYIDINNNELLHVLHIAFYNYKSWWILVGPDRPKYVRILNNYNLYFRTAIHSHLTTLIISLYKIYDKRKDTNNIRRLIKLVKNDNSFTEEELININKKFESACKIWEKIKILRHNYYAHLKYDLTPREIYKEAKIKPDEFLELINLSYDIFNIVRKHFKETEIPLVSPGFDLYNLLNDLKNCN